MNDLILGRKATTEEQAVIDKSNEMLLALELEIYAIGAPRPKKP